MHFSIIVQNWHFYASCVQWINSMGWGRAQWWSKLVHLPFDTPTLQSHSTRLCSSQFYCHYLTTQLWHFFVSLKVFKNQTSGPYHSGARWPRSVSRPSSTRCWSAWWRPPAWTRARASPPTRAWWRGWRWPLSPQSSSQWVDILIISFNNQLPIFRFLEPTWTQQSHSLRLLFREWRRSGRG